MFTLEFEGILWNFLDFLQGMYKLKKNIFIFSYSLNFVLNPGKKAVTGHAQWYSSNLDITAPGIILGMS